MQAVENLTSIRGTVVSRRPHQSLADYDILRIRLDAAEPVPGKADLLGSLVGGEIDVTVRRGLMSGGAGTVLRCRAKRTPDGAMCEPHPEAGDFELA